MREDAGFEVRHLMCCMNKVRDGKFSKQSIQLYLIRVERERSFLIEQLKEWCSYLDRNIEVPKIPLLSVEEAEKRTYISGYKISDFKLCKMLEIFQKNPNIPPPSTNHVSIFIMMLLAAVNDLSWAIGELNAHLS